jgi:hypothetical protein
MRIFFSIVLVFLFAEIRSQKISNRSRYEKCWAFTHPFAALKVKKIYKRCAPLYEEIKKNKVLDSFENGGKLDAFRHVFFMAAFSQKIKTKKVKKLGTAHEKGNHSNFLKHIKEDGELADSLSTVMDLQNNELGFRIGCSNKKIELQNLKNLVIEELKKGEAYYFKRNVSGQYLNCAGEVIILEKYQSRWFIPKCLVRTNE